MKGVRVIAAHDLTKTFGKSTRAVNGVSFELFKGETLGVVGESGCGKSTTVRMLLGLETPDSGEVLVGSTNIHSVPPASVRALRKRIQLVPQMPQTSFNPRLTIEASLRFTLTAQGYGRRQREERIAELFDQVGLLQRHRQAFPHQLSGGQLQRAAIARALGPHPEILVCDEAVSSLDKSVQAQVLNLLAHLQSEKGISMIFVSHDLAVVQHMSDRVLVMQHGKVVEEGEASRLYDSPNHPYTKQLLDSVLSR